MKPERFPHVPAKALKVRAAPGRNDPCPCGRKRANGKPAKYKDCHMPHGSYLGPARGLKKGVVNRQGPRRSDPPNLSGFGLRPVEEKK